MLLPSLRHGHSTRLRGRIWICEFWDAFGVAVAGPLADGKGNAASWRLCRLKILAAAAQDSVAKVFMMEHGSSVFGCLLVSHLKRVALSGCGFAFCFLHAWGWRHVGPASNCQQLGEFC